MHKCNATEYFGRTLRAHSVYCLLKRRDNVHARDMLTQASAARCMRSAALPRDHAEARREQRQN